MVVARIDQVPLAGEPLTLTMSASPMKLEKVLVDTGGAASSVPASLL